MDSTKYQYIINICQKNYYKQVINYWCHYLIFLDECIQIGSWEDDSKSSRRLISSLPFSKINRFVSTKDLLTLQAGQKVNDTVFNSCLDILDQSCPSTSIICRTYLLSKVFQFNEDTSGSITWSNHTNLPIRLKSLKGIVFIFLPLLFRRHYSLFVINLEQGTITSYDSLAGEDNQSHSLEIIKFIQYWASFDGNESIRCRQFESRIGRAFHQNDNYNCGVYVILTVKLLIEGSYEESVQCHRDININQFRRELMKQIIVN